MYFRFIKARDKIKYIHMNINSGSDSIYIYIYISTYKHIFIQVVEAIFKIYELKYFQRAHHIINIYIIIITVIIIEF